MSNIIQLDARTWTIEDSGVRVFVLRGDSAGLVIDSGIRELPLKSLAGELTGFPANLRLLNTHADMDHIFNNDSFDRCLLHPDEEPHYREKQKQGRIEYVEDGFHLDLGGRVLEIIHMPGHTPGSIGVLDRDARVLYGGDAIQDGNIYMFGPCRNMARYIESLQSLKANHSGRFDVIYPSHGSLPVEPAIIDKLIDGAQRILRGEMAGEVMELHGRQVRLCMADCAGFYCELNSGD